MRKATGFPRSRAPFSGRACSSFADGFAAGTPAAAAAIVVVVCVGRVGEEEESRRRVGGESRRGVEGGLHG